MPVQQVFVPLLDESKAKLIEMVPDVGMHVTGEITEVHPKVVVLMGESFYYFLGTSDCLTQPQLP
ncbi:hypothetical protein DRO03_01340 [Methanosarcinales archaeon]|nr:MAG: hypothetical protein DRO03_01340 [Methanosarcinales archaeon]